jgi:hypothetical protein
MPLATPVVPLVEPEVLVPQVKVIAFAQVEFWGVIAMDIVVVFEQLLPFVPVIVYVVADCVDDGVPEITPVDPLIDNPVGNVGDELNVDGEPVVDGVKLDIATF